MQYETAIKSLPTAVDGSVASTAFNLIKQKTHIGSIDANFHFLGIQYLTARPSNNTNVTHTIDTPVKQEIYARYLSLLRRYRRL